MRKHLILNGVALAAVLAVGSCSDGEDEPTIVQQPQNFTAVLSPANQTPPTGTAASGTATMSITPGGLLTYKVDVVNLMNPTLAHIHGPAVQGVNAGVKLNFCTQAAPYPICPTGAPFTGTLTAGVATQVGGISFDSLVVLLRNGNAYVNVHSTAFPGGEIRGQVVAAP